MALTRSMLKAMGIDEDKIEQIVLAHGESIEGLKKKAEDVRVQAERVPVLEKEIEELRKSQPTADQKAELDKVKLEFEAYKESVERERAEQQKAALYRSLLREKGVDEKRLDAIMKVTDLSGMTVEDGKLAGADELSKAIENEWGAFIVQTSTQGAAVSNPPSNVGAKMTREEILQIKDTAARQRAIAENLDQFR